MKYWIPFLTIAIFLTACGNTNKTTDNTIAPIQKEAPKSAHGIFTAGDDQTILEGSNALLSISILDSDKEFSEQVWKIGDEVLSTEAEFEAVLPEGEHHVILEAVDSEGNVYSDTIVINVKKEDAQNTPPTAQDISFTTNEDSSYKTALLGSDSDGDALSYLFVSYPEHGNLRGSAANLSYTPDANYYGSDSFRYKTNDGLIDSSLATVTISVNSINDIPLATAQSIRLSEDGSKNIVLSGNDIDKDALTFTYTNPSHGTFDGTTYIPVSNYFGSDSFTFTANDANEDSLPATVSIMIDPVNDAPTFTSSATLKINEDETYSYSITTNDIESESVSLSLTTAPRWLTLRANTLSGTPRNGDVGVHPIMITANDANSESTQTFNITVSNVNDIPKGIDDTITTLEDTPILIDVLANDTDDEDDILSIATISQPSHGVVEIVGTKVLYTPELDYHDTDTFTYQPKDSVNGNLTTVRVTVTSVDDQAIFSSIPITQAVEGSDYNYTIITSDVDNNITLSMGANTPDWLTLDNNTLSGTAPYGLVDAVYPIQIIANSIDQNFTITIKDINFAPAFTNTAIMIDTHEDNNTISGNFTAIDSDGDNYYFTTDSNLTGFTLNLDGTFDLNLSSAFYQSLQEDENISETVLVRVVDAAGASDEQNMTIMIAGINDTMIIDPITIQDSNLSDTNGTITGTITANDADDDVTFIDTNTTNNGFDINATTGEYTYTPTTGTYDYLAEGESTTLTIPIMINDVTQDITITIIGKNDAPSFISAPQVRNVYEDDDNIYGDFDVSDDKPSSLTFTVSNAPLGYGYDPDNASYQFNPAHDAYQSLKKDETISKVISIIAQDGEFNTTQNLTIMITGINDTPTAISDVNSTDEDSNLTFNILANDEDIDHNATFSLVEVNATQGSVSYTTDGNLTFSPIGSFDYLAQGEEHNVTLTYMMQDEYNATAFADINITITGVNDAPTIDSINLININENVTTANAQIVVNDAENNSLTFDSNSSLITFIDNNGTYIFNTEGNYDSLPQGETKIIPIMITISDGENNITQEINVTIIGVNTPPVLEIGDDYTITVGDTPNIGISSIEDVDGNITQLQYSWLVDGTEESTSNSLDYTFTQEKTYTIQLIVTDDKNATDSDSLTVTVNPAPIVENTFIPHSVTMNAIKPEWLEMVDLDKDGDLDILSAGNGGTKVGWYENRGDFTFDEHIISTTGYAPEAIKAADMDKDGDLDILYTTYDPGASLMQCFNDGNNTFPSCSAISNATDGLSYIEIADIDKDGNLDIISASWVNNRVDWYQNDGNGVYSTPYKINTTNLPHAISLHIVDFNKDSNLDVVAATNTNGSLYWYEKDQPTGFIEHTITGSVNGVYSVDVVDIDDNGFDDIISTSKTDGKIYWHKSTQDTLPTFGNPIEIATGLTNIHYASGVDMDNDDDIDILSASSEASGKIAWYENIGEDTNFTEHIVASDLNTTVRVFPADIDNDGNMDIVSCSEDGNITFYENPSTANEKKLPKTGQIISLITGDDGDLEKGLARSYTVEGENVIENHTNLMWQDDNDVTDLTFRGDAIDTYCSNKGGTYIDWRVPTIHELYYLADRGKTAPTIDDIFSNNPNTHFWSSDLGILSQRTYLNFSNSTENTATQNDDGILKNIRCVRGKALEFKFIRDDNQEVVRDYVHKLMWQDGSSATSTDDRTLEQAMTYCSTLTLSSYTDWRVPNINELYSIFDTDATFTAFHTTFKNRDFDTYWSTTAVPDSNDIITLGFLLGHDEVKTQDSNLSVRCVRDIP